MQFKLHLSKLLILSKNLTCMASMGWPLFCIKQTLLCGYWCMRHRQFQTAICVTASSLPQSMHCAPATHRTVIWCFVIWIGRASPRPSWILSSVPLLFIAFPSSRSSFQSCGQYSIHEGLPSLGFTACFKITSLFPAPPPFCLPY